MLEDSVTIEHGVGDQSTRIDDQLVLNCNRFTVTFPEVFNGPVLSLQLVSIQTVHVSSVVLVEIRELVVKQEGWVQIRRHVELNDTLGL